jgi:hypothetical protein
MLALTALSHSAGLLIGSARTGSGDGGRPNHGASEGRRPPFRNRDARWGDLARVNLSDELPSYPSARLVGASSPKSLVSLAPFRPEPFGGDVTNVAVVRGPGSVIV